MGNNDETNRLSLKPYYEHGLGGIIPFIPGYDAVGSILEQAGLSRKAIDTYRVKNESSAPQDKDLARKKGMEVTQLLLRILTNKNLRALISDDQAKMIVAYQINELLMTGAVFMTDSRSINFASAKQLSRKVFRDLTKIQFNNFFDHVAETGFTEEFRRSLAIEKALATSGLKSAFSKWEKAKSIVEPQIAPPWIQKVRDSFEQAQALQEEHTPDHWQEFLVDCPVPLGPAKPRRTLGAGFARAIDSNPPEPSPARERDKWIYAFLQKADDIDLRTCAIHRDPSVGVTEKGDHFFMLVEVSGPEGPTQIVFNRSYNDATYVIKRPEDFIPLPLSETNKITVRDLLQKPYVRQIRCYGEERWGSELLRYIRMTPEDVKPQAKNAEFWQDMKLPLLDSLKSFITASGAIPRFQYKNDEIIVHGGEDSLNMRKSWWRARLAVRNGLIEGLEDCKTLDDVARRYCAEELNLAR